MNKDFNMPSDLDADGKRAYDTIKKHLHDFKDLETGGCKSFYSPKEWNERGEEYGRNSVLIVVYDGGDLRRYFNMDACYEGTCLMADFYREMGKEMPKYNPYETLENLQAALHKEGFFVEECTGWYAAVYKN